MEIWKDIPWYEWLYQVSSMWNVSSCDRLKKHRIKWEYLSKWKILSQNWIYPKVYLYKEWIRKRSPIHRLVAQSFLWLDISDTKTYVCHKDDNTNNNNVKNLFLWTCKDNVQDMIKKWRKNSSKWKDNPLHKKIWLIDNWKVTKVFYWLKATSEQLQLNYGNLSQVCNGKRDRIWGLKFKYI